MIFIKGKCWLLHLGHDSPGCVYTGWGRRGWRPALGILVDGKLTATSRWALAAKRANFCPGGVHHALHCSHTRQLVVLLYAVLVQLHLECCVQLWPPEYSKDIKLLGGCPEEGHEIAEGFSAEAVWVTCVVQPREEEAEGRLYRGLQLPHKGRRRGRRWSLLCGDQWQDPRRWQAYVPGRFILGIWKKFFIQRVVEHWNRSPRDAVTAPSLTLFKKQLNNAEWHGVNLQLSCAGRGVALDDCWVPSNSRHSMALQFWLLCSHLSLAPYRECFLV